MSKKWVFEWKSCPEGRVHLIPLKRMGPGNSTIPAVDAVFHRGMWETDDDNLAVMLTKSLPCTRDKAIVRIKPVDAEPTAAANAGIPLGVDDYDILNVDWT
jgi:hypothetical protein